MLPSEQAAVLRKVVGISQPRVGLAAEAFQLPAYANRLDEVCAACAHRDERLVDTGGRHAGVSMRELTQSVSEPRPVRDLALRMLVAEESEFPLLE